MKVRALGEPGVLRVETPGWVAAKLASPQAYLLEEFAKAGLTPEVAGGQLRACMEQVEDHSARVKAIEAYLEATFGRAPTSTRNLNVNARVQGDKFFDPAVFDNPPPMLGQGAAGAAKRAIRGRKPKGE